VLGISEQAHRVTQHVLGAFENKQYSSAVFLDVKDAFDRVRHDGLLFKLKTKLPTAQYLLVKSYLLKRNFMVDVGDERSSIRCIQAGVPQGSVFGPVLYLPLTCRTLGNRVRSWVLLKSPKTFWTCVANGRIDATFR